MMVKKFRTISFVSLASLFVLALTFANVTADSLGPNNPGSGTETGGTGAGAITWNNTAGNITTPGSPYAVSNSIGANEATTFLTATNYNLSIPADATITGIKVDIKRKSSGNQSPYLRDTVVQLVVNGTLFGDNKALIAADWPAALAVQTYGGQNDLWGDNPASPTLTPANINNTNFGVVLSARNINIGRPLTATVDSIELTVYYTVNTTTTVACTTNPQVLGESTTCTATVTRVSGSTTPTGTLTWTSDSSGTFTATTCVLSGTGASASCSVDYTPSAVGTGTHKVTASFPGVADKLGTSSGFVDLAITVPGPGLALDKTADVTSFTGVGTVIHYSYVLTNNGNVALNGPFTVTDDKVTVTCPDTPSILAPAASLTCTGSYATLDADLTAKSVVNTATAHAVYASAAVNSSSDSVTVYYVANTTATVNCTPNPMYFGGSTTCTATVTSASANTQPAGTLTWTSDGGGAFSATTCNLSGADPNSATCSVDYTPSAIGTGNHKITASFPGVENSLGVSSGDVAVVVNAAGPGLTLDKTADITSFTAVGTVIHYSYVLTNNGNVTLVGPFTVTDNKVTVTCPDTPSSIAPTNSLTCTGSYTTLDADVNTKSVANTAVAHAFYASAPVDSDPDTVTVFYIANTTTTVDCTPNPLLFGGATTCTATVTSASTDIKPGGTVTWSSDGIGHFSAATCALTGADPNSANCSVEYTPTEVGTGHHKITASFPGVENSLGTSSGDKDVAITMPGPGLTLDKTADVTSFTGLGAAIHYSYLLTNNGNVTLSGPFTVTDDKATVTCPDTPSSLAPEATITCTATYTTQAADLTAKLVVNTATAHAVYASQPVNSDSDSVTVNYIPYLLYMPIISK